MLSIIIPTLNEENYLPFLLKEIKGQSFKDYEIIVADNNSTDRTKEIARSFGCRTVPGGLPARGRNQGAKFAEGDLFLFLDADVMITKNFLEDSLNEFKKRGLSVASYTLTPKTKNIFIKNGLNFFYNWPIRISQKFRAWGAMAILVKKEIFNKIGGFDEKIKLAEDHYFVQTAAKFGKFGILTSAKIYMHLRRFEKDGYLKTGIKYLFCGTHMLLKGPIKSDIIKYEFNHYSKKEKN
jgi:glycosyltransferase involved in cell wall biosynthesis